MQVRSKTTVTIELSETEAAWLLNRIIDSRGLEAPNQTADCFIDLLRNALPQCQWP